MKMKRTAIPLLLLFSATLTMIGLKSTAFADSKHIRFDEPVTIGSVVLQPDRYRVEWTGSGAEVMVTFMKGSKTFATATARLVFEKTPYAHRSFETTKLTDSSKMLTRISFANRALIFDLMRSTGGRDQPIAD